MDKFKNESTDKLLKVIIALLLRNKVENGSKLWEQIDILDNLNLKPKEIGEILGRTNSYINKELSQIRKSKKKGNKKWRRTEKERIVQLKIY